MSKLDEVMKWAEKLIKNRTCKNCRYESDCEKYDYCYNPKSGFHRFWKGENFE